MGTLTKRDLLWVALRLCGIYFFVQALQALPTLTYGLFFWSTVPTFHTGEAGDIARANLRDKSIAHMVSAVFDLVIYAPCAAYFLFGGRRLLKAAGGEEENELPN